VSVEHTPHAECLCYVHHLVQTELHPGHHLHNAEELVFITEISVYNDNYSIVISDKQHGLCQVNSNVVCSLLMKKEEIAKITLERNAFHFYQVQRPFFHRRDNRWTKPILVTPASIRHVCTCR